MRDVAVITGATSGIGAAFAELFAGEGLDLVVTGRRKEKLFAQSADIEAKYGVRVTPIVCELGDPDELASLIAFVKTIPNISYLINNAGFGLSSRFHEDDIDRQVSMLRVHNEAVLRLTHAAIPAMVARRDGAIVNVSSLASALPLPGNAMYCATKDFLNRFSQALAFELKPHGIRVQALLPGFTHTDFHEDLPGFPPEVRKSRGPVRWMQAATVAKISYRKLRGRKLIVVPGVSNKLLRLIIALTPKALAGPIAERRLATDQSEQ